MIGISCGAKAVHVNGVITDSVGHRNVAIHRAVGRDKFAATALDDEHTVTAIYRCAVFDTAARHFKAAANYMYAATTDAVAAVDGRVFGHGKSGAIKIDAAALL